MNTARLSAFVTAAEAGSFSAAAARIGQPLSGVSRHMTELEADLGVRLFDRTGRGVALTPAGERFLPRAVAALRELELGRAEVSGAAPVALDNLRLSGPPDLVREVFPAVLAALSVRFPALRLDVRADARLVSVVEEAYDAVVRLGVPRPSELLARRLGVLGRALYAAPGVPIFGLEDGRHEFTGVVGQARDLHARVDERPVVLPVQGRLWMSSFTEAAELAAQSDRVVVLPDTNALPFLRAGRLVPVGQIYRLPEIEVNLLRPPRHRGAPVLDQLADLLTDRLRTITQEVSRYRAGGPSDNLRVDA